MTISYPHPAGLLWCALLHLRQALGLIGNDLWVPESAIASIVLGGDIHSTGTRDEALEWYREKPASAL